jgi:hypothetical protein
MSNVFSQVVQSITQSEINDIINGIDLDSLKFKNDPKIEQDIKDRLSALLVEMMLNINNTTLKDIIKTKCFVAGGCFKSLYHNEPVNDYDFYFIDEDSKRKFADHCWNVSSKNFQFVSSTDNAITFEMNGKKIQFINRLEGFPDRVVEHFDFKHCQNYYIFALDMMKLDQGSLVNKTLVYNEKAPYPVSALKRMAKFVSQGWTISDEELMTICKKISALDLLNPRVYKEQTTGLYLTR